MPLLAPGQPFPSLAIRPVNASPLTVPSDVTGHYAVVLFYRGAWCPFCNAQLKGFQNAHDSLAALGVKVVALSVDDEDTTRALIAEHGLTFPVGHSADAPKVAALTGAFVNADPAHLQSTGFILDPDGQVVLSVYSSGAIGRLVASDVVGLIQHHQSRTASS